jgi:RNA polymerase-binding transcription factor DksA
MTSTVSPGLAPVPPYAVEYPDHWRRLQEERRFRLGQLEELDAGQPVTPRLESVQVVLRASAMAALDQIEAALARMEHGSYGRCVTCASALDAERLSILPMASLCMSCHYNEQNCHVASRLGRGS